MARSGIYAEESFHRPQPSAVARVRSKAKKKGLVLSKFVWVRTKNNQFGAFAIYGGYGTAPVVSGLELDDAEAWIDNYEA
jgi:hypothetical protein